MTDFQIGDIVRTEFSQENAIVVNGSNLFSDYIIVKYLDMPYTMYYKPTDLILVARPAKVKAESAEGNS